MRIPKVALLLSMVSCGGPPAEAPVARPSPAAPPASWAPHPPEAPRADVWALPPRMPGDGTRPAAGSLSLAAWKKGAAAKGVGASAPACTAFVQRQPAKPAPDLPAAIAETDVAKRDAALAASEATDEKTSP